MVRECVATVLGRSGADGIEPGQAFKDVGFDSLLAVELRNHLAEATGIRLPVTLVFDYPTPTALARQVASRLVPDDPSSPAGLGELEKVEGMLADTTADAASRAAIVERLQKLAARWGAGDDDSEIDLDTATDDEMFELLDSELGRS
jgi:acyl carrier protein